MTRPQPRRHARAVALRLLAVSLLSSACQQAPPPNIILYMVDTLRFDALGCNGNSHVHTPAMDRIAREGLRFSRAYANASWTRPSMGSLLTGYYPTTHGAIGRHDALRAGLRSLPADLRRLGYRTAAVLANPNIGRVFGFAEGFDDFMELQPARFIHHADVAREQVGTADAVARRAIAWLQTRPPGPFFLLIFTVDPHAPYEPPAPYDTMYDPMYTGKVDGSMKSIYSLLVAARLGQQPAPRDVQHLRALYHGEVSFNDRQLDTLLAEVGRQHLTPNTLLLLASDHGEEFYEHGYGEHGQSLYEELIHVPLLARWPGHIAPQRVYDGVVQLVDLYPTLLHLAGGVPPSGPGRDLSGIFLDSTAQVASSAYAEENLDEHNLRMILLGQRKLIHDAAHPGPLRFDLGTDPGEHTPLPGPVPADLTSTLQAAEELSRAQIAAAARVISSTQLPESVRRAMEALGYGDATPHP